eukprot:UN04073
MDNNLMVNNNFVPKTCIYSPDLQRISYTDSIDLWWIPEERYQLLYIYRDFNKCRITY